MCTRLAPGRETDLMGSQWKLELEWREVFYFGVVQHQTVGVTLVHKATTTTTTIVITMSGGMM